MMNVNAEDVDVEDVNVEDIRKSNEVRSYRNMNSYIAGCTQFTSFHNTCLLMNYICILRCDVSAKTHVMLAALIKEIEMLFIIMFSAAPTLPMSVLSYCILTLHIYEVCLAQAF